MQAYVIFDDEKSPIDSIEIGDFTLDWVADKVMVSDGKEVLFKGRIYEALIFLGQRMQIFQTRSEEHGLRYFETFEQAKDHADSDPTVWKISGNGQRLIRRGEQWVDEPILGAS